MISLEDATIPLVILGGSQTAMNDKQKLEQKAKKIEGGSTAIETKAEATKAAFSGPDPIGGGDKCSCGGSIIWTTEQIGGGPAQTEGRCNRCGKAPSDLE